MMIDGYEINQPNCSNARFPQIAMHGIERRLPFLLFRLEAELPSWLFCEANITDDGIVSIAIRDSVSSVLRIKLQVVKPVVQNQRAIHYLYADFASWPAFEQRVLDIYHSWARHSLP